MRTLLLGVCLSIAGLAQSPTLLLIDGKIWTGNSAQPQAEAVAIAGNRIIAVGSTADISKLKGESTRVIHLGGRRMLPGFNDAHVHCYEGGHSLSGPQLRYSSSQAEFRDTLAQFAQHVPRGQW